MTDFTKLSCEDFAEALASKSSVPGGGGSAALVGALGAALCSMVGNFTLGKKKYEASQNCISAMLIELEALRDRFLNLVQADALAFEPLSKAYSIPKDDPTRDVVMDNAAINACIAPIEVVVCCSQTITLLEEMLEKGNAMLISDVGCGVLLCEAAMQSAAINVFVNTATLKNRETADELETKVRELLSEYLPRARNIAEAVIRKIRKEVH